LRRSRRSTGRRSTRCCTWGGALGIVSQIEAIEAHFGKPFVSVNAATYWYALRKIGVMDPMPGFGQLLMHPEVAAV
jgi:maleate cis-trans isomerase